MMKNLSRTLFLVVFLMFVVSAVMAQDMDSLCQTSEETVKTTKPAMEAHFKAKSAVSNHLSMGKTEGGRCDVDDLLWRL